MAQQLQSYGHPVEIITSTPGPDEVNGIKVNRLPLKRWSWLSITRDPRTLPLLKECFAKGQYDLVHGHGLASSLAHLGIFQAKKQGIPTIMTSHSMAPEFAFGTKFFNILPALLRLPSLIYRNLMTFLLQLPSLIYRDLMTFKSLRPDFLTAVSTAAAEEAQRIYRVKKVSVLPDGINPERWKHTPEPHKQHRITTVMRLAPYKRPLALMRSIPKINERLAIDKRPIVTFIGEGPLHESLIRERDKLGLTNQVEILGYKTRHEICSVFAKTSFFVLPTRKEGFGIAVLEARCAGLPVVALNHGGIGEIVRHGIDGFLCNTDDEFIERTVQVLDDDLLRERLRRHAREPLTAYHWDHVITRHLELYEKALAIKPAADHHLALASLSR